jgi:rSAM/selenodomain-associated transferase 1
VSDTLAVVVMAKAPRPGLVKTRLAPLLGDDRCAALQSALITRTVAVATTVAPDATLVAFDPPDAKEELADILPPGVELVPQRAGHLGERLAAAVSDAYAVRPGPLAVIGTDIPLLEPRHLQDAAEALAAGADVVLGPARDGGYYLIGMHRPRPAVFDIDPELWGGPRVLAATLASAQAAGLVVRRTEALRDLDTPEDAVALAGMASVPSPLRDLLALAATAPGEGRAVG